MCGRAHAGAANGGRRLPHAERRRRAFPSPSPPPSPPLFPIACGRVRATMEEFEVPLAFAALADAAEGGAYGGACEAAAARLAGADRAALLAAAEEAASDLCEGEALCVAEPEVFAACYAIVGRFDELEPHSKARVLDALSSNLAVLNAGAATTLASSTSHMDEDVAAHRCALKCYVFLLHHLAAEQWATVGAAAAAAAAVAAPRGAKKAKKKAATGEWEWEAQCDKVLRPLAGAVDLNFDRMFAAGQIEDAFVMLFTKTAVAALEQPAVARLAACRAASQHVLASAAVRLGQRDGVVNALMQTLHRHEHMPPIVAGICAHGAAALGDTGLALEALQEVSTTPQADFVRDAAAAKHVGLFLTELADTMPKLVGTNLALLLPHFGCEAYGLRSGLVQMVGQLVIHIQVIFGDGASAKQEEVRVKSKQALLDLLIDRARDSNAFARAQCLRTWAMLCEAEALPIGHWQLVTEMAIGRLSDKASVVRRAAMQLVGTLLTYNPFGPSLPVESLEGSLQSYAERLEAEEAKIAETTPDEDDADEAVRGLHEAIEEAKSSDDEEEAQVGGKGADQLAAMRALVASLRTAVSFATSLRDALPAVVGILRTGTTLDQVEAVSTLILMQQFTVDGSDVAVKEALPLIFSREPSVRDAVMDAATTLYVPQGLDSQAAVLLSKFVATATLGELASMEEILAQMIRTERFPERIASSLWDMVRSTQLSASERSAALGVIGMIAGEMPETVNIDLVVEVALGPLARKDALLARRGALVLERAAAGDAASGLAADHAAFGALSAIIAGEPAAHLSDAAWYPACEQSLAAVYALHQSPETLIAGLITTMAADAFGEDGASLASVSTRALARFLFVLAHGGLRHLVFVEDTAKVVRREMLAREKAEEELAEKEGRKLPSKAETGAPTVDAIIDQVREGIDSEMMAATPGQVNLMGMFAPLVVHVVTTPALMAADPSLRSSAMLCLAKMMAIDGDFCEAHMATLCNTMQNSKEESVRSNCIVAIGDLAMRFPNVLEPWTSRVYACLRDPTLAVRKNALLVLTHLILNDMMKVKGLISDMAERLEDESPRVVGLARLFFSELAAKSNSPVYNLMPDMISRLSTNDQLSDDAFRRIMKFLVAFLDKDRHAEGLSDKLCSRFANAREPRVWRNLAYVLSQLALTEKAVKRMADQFKNYAEALLDPEVAELFKAALGRARRFASSDKKSAVEELEERIASHIAQDAGVDVEQEQEGGEQAEAAADAADAGAEADEGEAKEVEMDKEVEGVEESAEDEPPKAAKARSRASSKAKTGPEEERAAAAPKRRTSRRALAENQAA